MQLIYITSTGTTTKLIPTADKCIHQQKQERCLILRKHFTRPMYSLCSVHLQLSMAFSKSLGDYNELDWPRAVGHHMLLISISTCQLLFLAQLLQLVLLGVVPPKLEQRKTWTWASKPSISQERVFGDIFIFPGFCHLKFHISQTSFELCKKKSYYREKCRWQI